MTGELTNAAGRKHSAVLHKQTLERHSGDVKRVQPAGLSAGRTDSWSPEDETLLI